MFAGIDTLVVNQLSGKWLAIVILMLVWKLAWVAVALYRSLQLKQKTWFVILFIASFVLNDLGILAIIYLILTTGQKPKQDKPPKPKKKIKTKKR